MKILLRNRYSAPKLSLFFRQLAILLQSGLPLLRGLELLAEQSPHRQRLLVDRLERCLRRGQSLAQALGEAADFFPPLAVKLVAAGEESGELSSICEQLAVYYSRQAELERFLQQAVLYPALLLLVSGLVLLFFGVYILPVLAETYVSLGVQPTGSLEVLLMVEQYLTQISSFGWLVLLVLMVFLRYLGAFLLHHFLRSTWSGNFHGLLLEVRFCKLLALLLESGMAITQAVTIVAETVEDAVYAQQLRLFNSRLQRGIAIEQAACSVAKLFSPLLLELLCVGAATGCLPQLLRQAATTGQKRLEEQLGRLKQLLVPCLLLLLALITGSLVCAILQPLFNLLAVLPE